MPTQIPTVLDVKTYLGIPSSDLSQDALLTMLIDDAWSVIANYCRGRRFLETTYTEFANGNGTRFVILKQRPVLSVLNVWTDSNGYFGQGVNANGAAPFTECPPESPGSYALVLDETLHGSSSSAVTVTPGTPALFSWPLHGLTPGQTVLFSTSGVLPTGMTPGQLYYVIATGLTPDAFQVSPTLAGPGLTTTDAGTGTLTAAASALTVGGSGMLARINWNWPDIAGLYLPGALAMVMGQFLGNIRIQYVAGYPQSLMPRDLLYAVRLLVSIMRQTAPKGARPQSESVTDYSYSLMSQSAGQAPEIASIRQVLNRYREVPGLGSDISALPSNNTAGMWR